MEIVEEEASIIRRIFAAYAAGRRPRDIAHDLNREGVSPPRGKHWNASTINGNAQWGSGLIFNELYVGRIVWKRFEWSRIQIEVVLAALEEAPSIVTLHPATLDRYTETVDALAASLADHAAAEDDRGALIGSFRALVHSVTIHPNGPREGFEIEVKGKLAALIGGNAFPQAKYSGDQW